MLEESIGKGIGPSCYRDSKHRDPEVINGNTLQRTLKEGNNAGLILFQRTMDTPTHLLNEQRMLFVMQEMTIFCTALSIFGFGFGLQMLHNWLSL